MNLGDIQHVPDYIPLETAAAAVVISLGLAWLIGKYIDKKDKEDRNEKDED